ncbi:MAG: hypothetical protein RJA70_907 [Pseudomonadota bacterium]|jgi:4-amino-4-deoxy-L-arabinose transferase-like glycosyltransferase
MWVVAALLPRLFVAIAWAHEPVWDGHYYHFGATRIADGLGYSEDVLIGGTPTWRPWCHYPVGYSGFLGLVYSIFGRSLLVAPLANAVVGALTVGVVHRLALCVFSVTRARLAAVLCAVHPGLILYTALLMTEPLSAFGIALAGWAVLRFPNLRGAASAGVILGLSALVRPPALFLLPLLGFAFLPAQVRASGFFSRLTARLRRPLVAVALASVTALATISPWTLRNCRVMDGCALISTNGGWNLAIGALTETGRFVALSGKDGCPVVTGQVQQDRCWAQVGKERILDDPLRWLALIPNKLAHTYNHESFPVGYLAEADPGGWPEARKTQTTTVLTLFHHGLMLAAGFSVFALYLPRWRFGAGTWSAWSLVPAAASLGALGFVAYAIDHPEHPLFWLVVLAPLVAALRLPGAPETGPAAGYLWGAVFITSLTHAVFFGDDRYHIPISPLLCVLAAGLFRGPKPSTQEVPA